MDLREYSRQVESELATVEAASIGDYIEESGNIASLHNQIATCDNILGRMENLLLSFQSDLGSISSEILSLQQQSVDMNLRLKNRQAVRGELSQFVDDMVVTETLINTILEVKKTFASWAAISRLETLICDECCSDAAKHGFGHPWRH